MHMCPVMASSLGQILCPYVIHVLSASQLMLKEFIFATRCSYDFCDCASAVNKHKKNVWCIGNLLVQAVCFLLKLLASWRPGPHLVLGLFACFQRRLWTLPILSFSVETWISHTVGKPYFCSISLNCPCGPFPPSVICVSLEFVLPHSSRYLGL